jgi:cell division protease FtsH
MVGRWGMSERIGAMSVLPDPRREQSFSLDGGATSTATRELVESEVRRILNECSQQALDVLRAERARLQALVDALIDAETLDTVAAHRATGLPLSGAAVPNDPPVRG